MRFLVEMRSGASYEIEANYIEVVSGEQSSSYTLLGPTPGYPTAIIAVFPVELVAAVLPIPPEADESTPVTGGYADERVPAGVDAPEPAPIPEG